MHRCKIGRICARKGSSSKCVAMRSSATCNRTVNVYVSVDAMCCARKASASKSLQDMQQRRQSTSGKRTLALSLEIANNIASYCFSSADMQPPRPPRNAADITTPLTSIYATGGGGASKAGPTDVLPDSPSSAICFFAYVLNWLTKETYT